MISGIDPEFPQPGENVTIWLSAFSNSVYTGKVKVAVYLDKPSNSIDAREVVFSDSSIMNVTVSWRAVAGLHKIIACIDPDDDIKEIREDNNIYSFDVEVMANDIPRDDKDSSSEKITVTGTTESYDVSQKSSESSASTLSGTDFAYYNDFSSDPNLQGSNYNDYAKVEYNSAAQRIDWVGRRATQRIDRYFTFSGVTMDEPYFECDFWATSYISVPQKYGIINSFKLKSTNGKYIGFSHTMDSDHVGSGNRGIRGEFFDGTNTYTTDWILVSDETAYHIKVYVENGVGKIEVGSAVATVQLSGSFSGTYNSFHFEVGGVPSANDHNGASGWFDNLGVGRSSNPVKKYAIIVAGGASTKLKQTLECGSSGWPYKGTYRYYKNGFSWTDYTFYVDLKTEDSDLGSDAIGVMFRYENNNNYYRIRWVNSGSDTIYLEKVVNGNLYIISSKSLSLDNGKWYTLKIKLAGSHIRVEKQISRNGWQIVFDVYDNSISKGTIALYCWRNRNAWFDDVLVEVGDNFIDLDFERKKENDTEDTVCWDLWNPGSDYAGNWELSDSQEPTSPFVTDQEDFYKMCNYLYKKLKEKGYTIRYLSVDKWCDADEDGENDIWDIATNTNIQAAFNWMTSVADSNDKCLIYMFDHGMSKTTNRWSGWLYIDNNRDGDRKDPDDKLWDYQVGNWMDSIDCGRLIFVLEACYAGAFLDDVSGNDPSDDSRIVILSTDHKHEAQPWWNEDRKTDWPAFSKHFFDRAFQGYNLASSFNYAVDKVWQNNQHYNWWYQKQYPWLDDNGDGEAHGGHQDDKYVPSDGDGYLAYQTHL